MSGEHIPPSFFHYFGVQFPLHDVAYLPCPPHASCRGEACHDILHHGPHIFHRQRPISLMTAFPPATMSSSWLPWACKFQSV